MDQSLTQTIPFATVAAPNSAHDNNVPRPEYPRPQLVRNAWINLNGPWEFEFDDANEGIAQGWYLKGSFSRTIVVPFAYQSRLSGIGDTSIHDIVWYRRTFQVPESFNGKRLWLHFGAVDYYASVWVNGQHVGDHEGGHTPFCFDVTELVHTGDNVIVVRAEDRTTALDQPRGKQYWKERSESIFYTRTTGIWQTVWLEAVPEVFVRSLKFTPDIDEGTIRMDVDLGSAPQVRDWQDLELTIAISFAGAPVSYDRVRVQQMTLTRIIALGDFNVHDSGRLWSPEHPNLYDVQIILSRGPIVLDEVTSYFGMRKISVEAGRVFLNNRPYTMKLILDQGYFPDGVLTPPSDDDIRRDVELTKRMGFNGARKHQKVEDPRYLYWCDKLGLLVWGEMANAYEFTEASVRRMTQEWQEVISRDYNHPCIVAWVPINESWGVPRLLTDERQRAHLLTLYYLTKSLDPTRLVISNDGWEHAISDLCTIHDYEADGRVLAARYQTAESAVTSAPASRLIYAPGFAYRGEPILVTECGGISYKKDDAEGWGYSRAESDEDFLRRYAAVVGALLTSPVVQGFCYTQLTDVEQEINGLLTYHREPKVDLDLIRQINEGKAVFD